MTTEDIRVIRPACERFFTGKYSTLELISGMVLNLLLKHKDFNIPLFDSFKEIAKLYVEDKEYSRLNKKEYKNFHSLNNIPSYIKSIEDIAALFSKAFQNDGNALASMSYAIRDYICKPEKERNVFVFEGRFYDKFSKIKINNLTLDHLPREASGCIVLPKPIIVNEARIDEILFVTCPTEEYLIKAYEQAISLNKKNPEKYHFASTFEKNFEDLKIARERGSRQLIVVGIDREKGCVSLNDNYFFTKNDSNAILQDTTSATSKDISKNSIKNILSGLKGIEQELLLSVLNLLAYINSGKPDIREFKNTIRYRGKSTVNVRPEDEELSRGKLFLVGFNWLKNAVYKVDGWWSSGYMAWRMCGEGRKEPRLVYFKGSFKQRRKGKEEIITEDVAIEGEDFEEC